MRRPRTISAWKSETSAIGIRTLEIRLAPSVTSAIGIRTLEIRLAPSVTSDASAALQQSQEMICQLAKQHSSRNFSCPVPRSSKGKIYETRYIKLLVTVTMNGRQMRNEWKSSWTNYCRHNPEFHTNQTRHFRKQNLIALKIHTS